MTEFSKKTGDYPSLSATDIKVLALTYQLELENVGSQHLREEPEVKVPAAQTRSPVGCLFLMSLIFMYIFTPVQLVSHVHCTADM